MSTPKAEKPESDYKQFEDKTVSTRTVQEGNGQITSPPPSFSQVESSEPQERINLGDLFEVEGHDHPHRCIGFESNGDIVSENSLPYNKAKCRKYKPVPPSKTQEEMNSNVLEVVGNFLHSSGLVFHTDDADHVASDLIRYLKIEGFEICKTISVDSQDELITKLINMIRTAHPDHVKTSIKQSFTITRK